MSTVKSLTATGVATGKYATLFGITASTEIPAPAPTGNLIVEVRDSSVADGSGDLIARVIITLGTPEASGMETLTFGDGVRCANGIAVNLTLNGHDDVVVSIDYS